MYKWARKPIFGNAWSWQKNKSNFGFAKNPNSEHNKHNFGQVSNAKGLHMSISKAQVNTIGKNIRKKQNEQIQIGITHRVLHQKQQSLTRATKAKKLNKLYQNKLLLLNECLNKPGAYKEAKYYGGNYTKSGIGTEENLRRTNRTRVRVLPPKNKQRVHQSISKNKVTTECYTTPQKLQHGASKPTKNCAQHNYSTPQNTAI